MDNDQQSLFENDDPGLSYAISLTQLSRAVSKHLRQPCQLSKLGEGSFHKVYRILRSHGPLMVVRVARPCMARDKMESEVATMKYLAGHNFPVPKIYAWDSGLNATGAEYMVMEKVPGHSADSLWDNLSLSDKKKIVTQVAQHLLAAFQLQFDQAGSLYLSHAAHTSNPYYVGPIVTSTFFQVEDGLLVYSDWHVADGIQKFRGPFSNTADWLSHSLRAEIFALKSTHDHEFDANAALANMDDAVIPLMKSPHMPFSFRFDDISLKNIMIDGTCQITGFIDLECTMIAPLWECATVPIWLLPEDDADGFTDRSFAEKEVLRNIFLSEISHSHDGQEWLDAYEMGRDFQKFSSALWMQDRFDWARLHPGVGCPNPNEYRFEIIS
ncbi:hypothetical protein PILCRDRAFT_828925 [Piloderma croceum F 1598]|uniref:Aminoglycoside phosphotransferase domain-containing protein n=1 Tax=Piloderma croceum (strain F 1598) TaxID=765440 RepID=A0A0C3F0M8_PILCF|nr:hypothetical protein PILCRDRAFT_828925 [Piloderma croceum F 1598]